MISGHLGMAAARMGMTYQLCMNVWQGRIQGGGPGGPGPPPPSLTHTPHTPTCDTHKAQTCNTASI